MFLVRDDRINHSCTPKCKSYRVCWMPTVDIDNTGHELAVGPRACLVPPRHHLGRSVSDGTVDFHAVDCNTSHTDGSRQGSSPCIYGSSQNSYAHIRCTSHHSEAPITCGQSQRTNRSSTTSMSTSKAQSELGQRGSSTTTTKARAQPRAKRELAVGGQSEGGGGKVRGAK